MSSVVDADHIERDTDASEEVDLLTLLLPDATLPKTHRRCAFAYNAALLAGWVKQSSPACAAGEQKISRDRLAMSVKTLCRHMRERERETRKGTRDEGQKEGERRIFVMKMKI